MRIRYLKPEFFVDEDVTACSPLARLAFAGLWCVADREGRIEDRPARLKMQLLPADACDMSQILDELVTHNLIMRYMSNGARVIVIPGFIKHQRPHPKEAASTLPAAKKNGRAVELHGKKLKGDVEQAGNGDGDGDGRRYASSDARRLADLLASLIRERLPKARIPASLDKWATAIDRLNRIDGHDWAEVERVMRWSQADSFWQSNILSGAKLRKQFDTLDAQSRRPANGRKDVTQGNLDALAEYNRRNGD